MSIILRAAFPKADHQLDESELRERFGVFLDIAIPAIANDPLTLVEMMENLARYQTHQERATRVAARVKERAQADTDLGAPSP